MNNKWKWLSIITLLSVVVVLVFGCAQNPRGSYGPAWDVAYKVPLVKDKEKTIKELLPDNEDIIVPEEDATDTKIKFKSNFEDMDFPTVDIGGELAKIELPSNSQTVNLDPVSIDAPSISEGYSGILAVDGSFSTTEKTLFGSDFSAFRSAEFTSSGNSLNINVDTSSLSTGTIDMTATFEYTTPDGTSSTDDVTFTVSAGDGDSTPEGQWMLNDKNIDFQAGVKVSISGTISNGDGNSFSIDFGFSSLEVAKVVDLEAGRIDDQSFSPSVDFGSIEAGVQDATFKEGKLYTKFDPDGILDGSGLSVKIYQFEVNNLSDADDGSDDPATDSDNDGVIDLSSATLDTSSGLNINFTLNVSTSSSTITYDTTKDITVKGGFSDGTNYTKASIDSVSVDSDYFSDSSGSSNGLSTDFGGEEVLTEIPDQISKLSVNDANIDFTIDHGISNLKLDLSGVKFKALDSNGNLIGSTADYDDTLSLATLDKDGSGTITATDSTLSLKTGDFVNWLGDLPADQVAQVVLDGSLGVGVEDDTKSVTISASSSVVPAMSATIGFDFTLNEDLTRKLDPTLIGEAALTQDQVDNLKQVVKEVRLIIKELNNQLPMRAEVEIYVGSINDWSQYETEEELKSYLDGLSSTDRDNELAKLYKQDNLLKSIDIKQNTKEKKEFVLKPEDGEVFTKDNLFVGVKITIPSGDVVLNSTDKINLTEAYATLVTKVNQPTD